MSLSTDAAYLAAFHDGTLPAAGFNHLAHCRVAFCQLTQDPFLEACIAVRDGLRRFAAAQGQPGLYHETITVAFMSVVAERMRRHPGATWPELLAACPELADKALLQRWYRPELLGSPEARAAFVLPEGRA